MEEYKLNPALLLFVEKLYKLLNVQHNMEVKQSTFIITFYKGKIIKKDVIKISQTDKLVGVDLYLDNLDDKVVPDIEHMLTHLESLLSKKDIQLIVNKIEL